MRIESANFRLSEVNLALCAVALILTAIPASAQPRPTGRRDRIADQLRARIESADASIGITIGPERTMAHRSLPEFYSRRDYRPAWIGERAPLTQARRLSDSVRAASQHGLDPRDYHLQSIEALLDSTRGSGSGVDSGELLELADLELLLTDAFLTLGSDLLVGRVDPRTFDATWPAESGRRADLPALLDQAIASGRIEETLSALAPREPGYARLKDALRCHRAMAAGGGWRDVPESPKLELGMRDARVVPLRERLAASGDLPSWREPTEDFDETVSEAVRSFQARHGLQPDGVVGAATLAALNVPVEERVRQIERNLERRRWLLDDLGERYLLINIPGFELDVIEGHRSVLNMKAVVGMPSRPTPVFSAEMTYLVLNPYWEVPHNIAVSDIVPAVRKDPDYLEKRSIKVFEGWSTDAREVDPSTLDWAVLGKDNFPYRLRQEPGPTNALGAVKFVFPNPYDVYLHDTPSRELFARSDRACSSGCVRVEKAIELAHYLLGGDSAWNREHIFSVIDQGTEQTIRLPRTFPVHFVYWTSWADPSGTVHFREDIYGRDPLLDEALGEVQSSPLDEEASSR